jgi:hypothetical protein
VNGLLPVAFAALLLSYMESVSAARAFAAKHGYSVDAGPFRIDTGRSKCRSMWPAA